MPRHAPELACPRCGYDVSGMVPTWTESCPLEGTCSECGLVYAWVDIFRPDRVAPAWSFEHGREKLRMRWYATAARSLWPSRFWRGLSLAAPIRAVRLGVFTFLVLALAWLGAASCGALAGYQVSTGIRGAPFSGWGMFPQLPNPWNLTLTYALWPGFSGAGWWDSLIEGGPLFVVTWAALMGLPFLVLRQSLMRAKCRPIHLLRGWSYQWPAVGLIVLPVLLFRAASIGPWGSPWGLQACSWMALIAGGWLAWYWTAFVRTYLRLPHAIAVTASMLIISGLTVLLVDFLLSPPHSGLLEKIARALV